MNNAASHSTANSAANSASRTPAAPDHRRMAGIVVLLLIGLCLLFVVGYVQRLAERESIAAQIGALEQQIAKAEVRQAVLSKELAQANDDAHIAAVARDALNLVQEGDQPLILIDPPAAAVQPVGESAAATPVNTQPNWQRWFDLIFGGR